MQHIQVRKGACMARPPSVPCIVSQPHVQQRMSRNQGACTRWSRNIGFRPVAQQSTGTATNRARARTKDDLNDPAQIGATGTAGVNVPDYGGAVSLASYMMLPIEQYFVLDPNQIKWIEGNRFLLTVPRIELFNIWLEPEVEISVTSQASPPRIVLQAENCKIRGSDMIEGMQLDQRFCLRFVTDLTWATRRFDATSSDSSDGSDLDDSPGAPVGEGKIEGKLKMDVWCEVIPPFNLMPREVLQASCNVVMHGLVGSLLPMFVQRLGSDYKRWATDTEYRIGRASRSIPLA